MILHRGVTLRLEHGVVVALLDRASTLGWNCLVVGGSHPHYKPGGHDIFVFDADLQKAAAVTAFVCYEDVQPENEGLARVETKILGWPAS